MAGSGGASVKDKTLTLTVANPHISDPQEIEIVVRGAAPGPVKVAQLASADVQAHNTFAQPNAIVIKDGTAGSVANGVLVQRLPPASVTRLQFTLA